MRDLRALLQVSKARAPILREQLRGIDIPTLQSRADIVAIPVMRRHDMLRLQGATPPFGGFSATRPAGLRRLLIAGNHLFNPEGHAKDWWNVARVLFAAGIRKGELILNCFSYHLMSGGHMVDSGAQALGCPVIPAGDSEPDRQLGIIQRVKPVAVCGTGTFVSLLLETAIASRRSLAPIRTALVAGPGVSGELRARLASHGITMHHAYGATELGAVAYETAAHDGLVVNEGLIVEIVRPGTGEPVAAGHIGEIVVTRLNADYPLLRFGTGDLSAVLPGVSACGRTNMRLTGFLGRVTEAAEVEGRIVHRGHLDEILARHPSIQRLRLVLSRVAEEQDSLLLQAECGTADGTLEEKLTQTLRSVTKLRGKVALVRPGSLPDDGRSVVDERAAR